MASLSATDIQNCARGVPATCFFSERWHLGLGGPKAQVMWFNNNDNVTHTWHIDHNITGVPQLPSMWKVEHKQTLHL